MSYQRTISVNYPVARKNYGCGACDWITEQLDDLVPYLSFTEKRAVVIARMNGWRIMKGEKHIRATIVGCEGELYTWRGIIDIDKLCKNHNVYENVC